MSKMFNKYSVQTQHLRLLSNNMHICTLTHNSTGLLLHLFFHCVSTRYTCINPVISSNTLSSTNIPYTMTISHSDTTGKPCCSNCTVIFLTPSPIVLAWYYRLVSHQTQMRLSSRHFLLKSETLLPSSHTISSM